MHEFHKKHRPTTFKGVIGQPDAVRILNEMWKNKRVPHCMLFSGPSGCGKTTLARIVAEKLECGPSDVDEINCADFRGIDKVREIRGRMSLAPMGGKAKVYLIDEAHQLSTDAQNALLKMLEDTPKHVYFMLATTEPDKLIKTIRTRATDIVVKGLTAPAAMQLINSICSKEKLTLSEEVKEKVIEYGGGSARQIVKTLDTISGIESEEDQLTAIAAGDKARQQSIELCRALLNRRPWKEIAGIIKGIEEEPETLRWMVLGYATNVLLGGGKLASRCALLIAAFSEPYFYTKKAGLVSSCWEVTSSQ